MNMGEVLKVKDEIADLEKDSDYKFLSANSLGPDGRMVKLSTFLKYVPLKVIMYFIGGDPREMGTACKFYSNVYNDECSFMYAGKTYMFRRG